MNDAPTMAREIEVALDAGDVIVLLCRTSDTIASARLASRRASTWLHGVTALRNGRLCRSATAGMGVVAAHRTCAIGIDVERANTERVYEGIAGTLLHPIEFDDLFAAPLARDTLAHVWVRKEATLKAFGVGLAVAPTSIATGAYCADWRTVTHGILGTAMVKSLPAPDGFAISVALLGTKLATVRSFDFE
jgi:phosphopantetheinyl transferase (holo-ACP synthase)